MKREGVEATGILHVAGRVTDDVFSFLGPAVRALAARRRSQKVVLIDAPEFRHNVERFVPYASVVRVAATPNPVHQWIAVLDAFEREFDRSGPGAVHAHGVLPLLSIRWKLRGASSRGIPVFYSPYSSRSLRVLDLPIRMTMRGARALPNSAIVPASHFTDAGHRSVPADRVECPVSDVFFTTPREESKTPLIVGSGREENAKGIELFCRLAVQLSGEELGLEFAWLGQAAGGKERKLQAAGIAVRSCLRDDECAHALRSAWIHVTPWPAGGFPFFLVQAMAAGLPCVALDCRQHREVIVDGRTGFLCASESDMVARVAELVDDAALRNAIGTAARHAASARFDESAFQAKLITAYSTLW